LILTKNVCKKFQKPVLNNINFEGKTGEIIGIAGENGSGKSTLLSIVAGLMKPDGGEVHVTGKIGYVPQENALFDNLSVRDNLNFWASAYGVKEAEYGGWLDGGMMKKKVYELSGGMKKRLSIALACLHKPDWLIMDEPSAALDIGFKGILLKNLEERRGAGAGVVFTSHQPDELLWCDRIYILRDGAFVYEGKPQGIDLPEVLYG